MLITLGIDAVEISRCANWHLYNPQRLARLFTEQEIAYCLSNPAKSAERFAARFATKEACFKALSAQLLPMTSFFTVCQAVELIKHADGRPELYINWQLLTLPTAATSVSLSHTRTTALAVVLILKI